MSNLNYWKQIVYITLFHFILVRIQTTTKYENDKEYSDSFKKEAPLLRRLEIILWKESNVFRSALITDRPALAP